MSKKIIKSVGENYNHIFAIFVVIKPSICDSHLCIVVLKLSIMVEKFKPGTTVYLIANTHFIEEATVVMTISGFVTIRFTEREGGTRIRESRLYATREEAEAVVAQNKARQF